ncbi:MAG: hypothetical protein KJ747_05200 [Actinobacteria bacterium]|nr:hypothetical protein [Actinomycetota bacterium]MCG2807316.1 hypothetical protein [Coriobacteriia bacterium]
MDSRPLSERELRDELAVHVGFLLSSARAYDAGDSVEVRRLAGEMRALSEPPLGLRESVDWYDTCHAYTVANALPHYGLLSVRHHEVLPAFDAKGESRRFVPWRQWCDAVVLSDGQGGTLTRWELLRTMADKQAAHVDLRLPELYASLRDSDSAAYRSNGGLLVFSFRRDGDPLPREGELLPEPVAPSVRQLAHEVLVSLAMARPDLFAEGDLSGVLEARPGRFGIRNVFMPRELVADAPLSMCVARDVRSLDGDSLG